MVILIDLRSWSDSPLNICFLHILLEYKVLKLFQSIWEYAKTQQQRYLPKHNQLLKYKQIDNT